MRELKLKYFMELVSNLGAKAMAEAKVLIDAQKAMDKAVAQTTDKMVGLDRALSKAGTNSSTERQITYMQRLGQAIDAASRRALKLRQNLAGAVDKVPEWFATGTAGYYGAKKMIAPPLSAYSSLEAATTDLRISMLDAKGQVSKDFDKISAEAVKLGNQLPGTTKDFMLAARALQTQGVPSSVIANGGLRASGYVGALMGLDQAQAAEVIAKLREAHGLKDDELVKAADLVQRGFFGFGIKPQEYLETAKYAAPTYNSMGMTGYQKTKETLAIQGMAANVGLEGSSFGTNYAMMLTRLGQIDTRKNRNSKEAREVREMLGEHGIDMQFYGDDGKFSGNVNMLQQLAKLRALNPLEQTKVINRLFGVEAGRPAQILVQKGLEGYNAALKTIDSQADLDQRIAMKMETFASKLEALGGTIVNVQAQIATQLGQSLKPAMDGLNNLGGPIGGFFKDHPTLGTAGLLAAGAGGMYLGGRVGGALFKALILRGAPETGAVAAGAAQAGAPGGAAAAGAAPVGITAAARAAKILKYGGVTAAIGAGLEGVRIMADDKADKTREFSRLGVTTGAGLLGGAAAGAALGSVVPVVGTLLGAIIGGLAGNYGSGALFDSVWKRQGSGAQGTWGEPAAQRTGQRGAGFNDPRRLDFLALSSPGRSGTELTPNRITEMKLGEGTLAINVRVTDERVTATPTVERPLALVRINAGATRPEGRW